MSWSHTLWQNLSNCYNLYFHGARLGHCNWNFMVCVLHWSLLHSLPVKDKIKILLFQQKHRWRRKNDTGTLTFTIYLILSYKKNRSAATQLLPPYLCSEQSDVNEVYCKIYHHNWQPLKIQQEGQLLARLLPWWCEPLMRWRGKGREKNGYSSGLMVRLCKQFLYCWAGCKITKQT